MVNQLFTDGYGRLALDRYAFQRHLAGFDPSFNTRHKAGHVDLDPALNINDTDVYNVQDALAATSTELNILELSGKGFITIGDGYDTYHFSNYADPAYVSDAPDPAYDSSVPALNTYLDNLLNIIDHTLPGYNPLNARIRDGGIVLIKAGTYKFTGTVNIPAGIILMGENYGTKIVNQMASPAPLFKSIAPLNRIPDIGVDVLNTFMFNRDSALVNITIADNFLVPKFTGDFDYTDPINNDSVTPLVSIEGGSSLICENVKFIGKTTYTGPSVTDLVDVTSFAIKLNNPVTTGTYLKVNNCFMDGFAQPISFDSTGGRNDYLEVTNSKIRSHGYLGAAPAATDPATMFGDNFIHSWDSYDGTTWTDSVGELNGTMWGGVGLPGVATQNGHTHPVFVDANNDQLATVPDDMLGGLTSWTIYFAYKGSNFYNGIITKPLCFFVEPTGGFVTTKFAYYNFSGGTDLLTTTVINDNAWHRGIITVNGNAGQFYVDGALEASGVVSTMPSDPSQGVFLGGAPSPFGSCDGSIAIIGVAVTGLSGPEVTELDTYLDQYINGIVAPAGEEANCVIHMNDNNALISNNEFYGNHDGLTTICYIKDKIVAPAAQDKSHIIISSNIFTVGKGGSVVQGNPFVIDAGIIGTFSSNAFTIYDGNLTGSGYVVGANGVIALQADTGFGLVANGDFAFGNSIVEVAENNISIESTAGSYSLLTAQDVNITATNDIMIESSTARITLNAGIATTKIANVTASTYAITAANYILLVATSTIAAICNITLPTPTTGTRIIIKDKQGLAGTYNIILHPNVAELIDGVTGSFGTPSNGIILSANWGTWEFVSDGTNWFKL